MVKSVFYADEEKKEMELYFLPPTHEELLAIDMEYRKIYSMAVRESVITNAEALKRYKTSGAWEKEDENSITDFIFKLKLLETVITDEKEDNKKRKESAFEATQVRADLLQKMNIRTGLFDHTAESMAEEQKIHKYILLCCRTVEDDERLFDSREEQQQFSNDNNEIMSTIYRKAYFFVYNLSDDISADWAEVQFMKTVADEIKKEAEEAQDNQETKKVVTKKKKKVKKTVTVD